MKERGIELYLNKVLREIREKEVFFADGSSLPSDLTIIIPPYKAAPIFRKNRLGDEEGFIPTDESMKHLDFDNIYAIGDINALAQPKLGHIAVHQADVAVSAILKDWRNEGEILPFRPEIFCIMNMGGNDATLIYSDVLFGGSHDLAFRSPLAHMMKWGFDSYYFYTKGHMPPDFSVEALEGLLDLLSRKKSK
jgi:sulfide:quinone oxidoreductase